MARTRSTSKIRRHPTPGDAHERYRLVVSDSDRAPASIVEIVWSHAVAERDATTAALAAGHTNASDRVRREAARHSRADVRAVAAATADDADVIAALVSDGTVLVRDALLHRTSAPSSTVDSICRLVRDELDADAVLSSGLVAGATVDTICHVTRLATSRALHAFLADRQPGHPARLVDIAVASEQLRRGLAVAAGTSSGKHGCLLHLRHPALFEHADIASAPVIDAALQLFSDPGVAVTSTANTFQNVAYATSSLTSILTVARNPHVPATVARILFENVEAHVHATNGPLGSSIVDDHVVAVAAQGPAPDTASVIARINDPACSAAEIAWRVRHPAVDVTAELADAVTRLPAGRQRTYRTVGAFISRMVHGPRIIGTDQTESGERPGRTVAPTGDDTITRAEVLDTILAVHHQITTRRLLDVVDALVADGDQSDATTLLDGLIDQLTDPAMRERWLTRTWTADCGALICHPNVTLDMLCERLPAHLVLSYATDRNDDTGIRAIELFTTIRAKNPELVDTLISSDTFAGSINDLAAVVSACT